MYILNHQVTGTHNHLTVFAGLHLRLRHPVVEVWVVGLVAGGVHTVADVDGVVLHLLHRLTHQPAIALLCCDVLDLRTLGLDVVLDGIHMECASALRELWACYHHLVVYRVASTEGINLLVVKVNVHKVGSELHIVVAYVTLTIEKYLVVAQVVVQRVGRLTRNHSIDTRALAFGALGLRHRVGEVGYDAVGVNRDRL